MSKSKLYSFKTINGESLIGEGDISPMTEEVKNEIIRAVNAGILPNLEGKKIKDKKETEINAAGPKIDKEYLELILKIHALKTIIRILIQ